MPPRKGTPPPNKLPAGIEKRVAALYAIERSSRRVAEHFGIAKGTVLRIAAERGITMPAWGLSRELSRRVVNSYLNDHKSGPDVAAAFNITSTTLYTHLRKSGHGARTVADYDQEEKCNHGYFDLIDRPEKAYWLGMLLADGCVSRENEVILSLHVRDIDTVRAFKSVLGSHAKISIREQLNKNVRGGKRFKSTSAAVRVRSRRLCAALAKYGILPGKTRSPRMARGFPPEFEKDFWRGAVDGDGLVVFSKRPNGGMPVVRAFQRFCRKHCLTRARILPNHSVYQFGVTDWFAFDIANLMYGRAGISLPRKYKRYEAALAYFGSRTRQVRNWSRTVRPRKPK